MDPPDQLWYAGGYRHWLHLGPKHYLTSELDNFSKNGIIDVDFISGCCMFVPANIFSKNGGFFSEYIAYSEDNEWCWRIQRQNKKLHYVPKAVMWHHLSASLKKNTNRGNESGTPGLAYYLITRNNLWSIRHHARPITKKYLALTISAFLSIKIMFLCLLNNDGYKINSLGKGLWNGLFGLLPTQLKSFD